MRRKRAELYLLLDSGPRELKITGHRFKVRRARPTGRHPRWCPTVLEQ